MDSEKLNFYLENVLQDYRKFMHNEEFPKYKIKKIIDNDFKGLVYGKSMAKAKTIYKEEDTIDHHELLVAPNVVKESAEYVVYHELTHILDAEQYGKNKSDATDSAGYSGFHAAQVEMMKLIEAKDMFEPFEFTMQKPIKVIRNNLDPEYRVQDYMVDSYNLAFNKLKQLKDMSENQKPLEPEIAFNLLEPVFNYWGRRSVCQKFAKDYVPKYGLERDPISIQRIEDFLCRKGYNPIRKWDNMLCFNMDKYQILAVNKLYGDTIDYYCF